MENMYENYLSFSCNTGIYSVPEAPDVAEAFEQADYGHPCPSSFECPGGDESLRSGRPWRGQYASSSRERCPAGTTNLPIAAMRCSSRQLLGSECMLAQAQGNDGTPDAKKLRSWKCKSIGG